MDPTLIAELTLAVGVITIAATLIAPKLIATARIAFQTFDLSRIDTQNPADNVQIQVLHNGTPIHEPVFLTTILFQNVGSKDVTREEFLNPIAISLGSDVEILSAGGRAPEGVDPNWQIHDGLVQLTWTILKPGEEINTKIVGKVRGKKFNHSELFNSVNVVARLRDVKIGYGLRRYWAAFLGIGAGIGGLTLLFFGIMLLGSLYSTDRWVFVDPASHRQLVILERPRADAPDWYPNRAGISRCPLIGRSVQTAQCVAISEAEAQQAISKARRFGVREPPPPQAFAFVASVAAALVVGLSVLLLLVTQTLRRLPKRAFATALRSR